jgi:hypothetical protein
MFPVDNGLAAYSGEGFYFSAVDPSMVILLILNNNHQLYMLHWDRLDRYNIFTKNISTVLYAPDVWGPNTYLWQMHSSYDDTYVISRYLLTVKSVHSGTLKSGIDYGALGCFVYKESTNQKYFYPFEGNFYWIT